MARMQPLEPATSTGRAKELLDQARAAFGRVPRTATTMAVSPATLEGWLGLGGALRKGRLDGALAEQLALAISEANSCDYCLAAHSFVAKRVYQLSDEAILASREGRSDDPKVAAALRFALAVAEGRGSVTDDELAAVRAAGFDDSEIVEIVGHVAQNVLTNYVNKVAQVEPEHPPVAPLRPAA